MTNEQVTLQKEIERLEKIANCTTNNNSANTYNSGFKAGETLLAIKALSVIKKLQEIINLQTVNIEQAEIEIRKKDYDSALRVLDGSRIMTTKLMGE